MKRKIFPISLLRRLEAVVLAAGTLWVVTVTAGSDTAASAAKAVWEASPINALRWSWETCGHGTACPPRRR